MEAGKIEIKGFFTDWQEVSIEQACSYVLGRIKNSTMPVDNVIVEINRIHLRGITVRELAETGNNPELERLING